MIFIHRSCLFLLLILCLNTALSGQDETRWQLTPDGGIQWETKRIDSHVDHVEMSGFEISAIVHYGVKQGRLDGRVHLVFPLLRTIPNNTHGSLDFIFDRSDLPKIKVNGNEIFEYPNHFYLKGFLEIQSITKQKIEISRKMFPSTDHPAFIEQVVIKNNSSQTVEIEIPVLNQSDTTKAENGVNGSYVINVSTNKAGSYMLPPSDSMVYSLVYTGRLLHGSTPYLSSDYEFLKRKNLMEETFSDLNLVTPDEILNSAFNFAKLRAVESIYATKGGLMHGPGGGRYYAAIWANDQAEYANPFFPFLGNLAGNESAINSFRHFAKYMNNEFQPIPSSIVAEGLDYWNGAGDRGDMAMIAYGASRFCLANGNKQVARELWPLIEWCLEYCRRKLNDEGVVQSDCDELENRFPAGDANLNTSSLYYDALISSVYLGSNLDINDSQLAAYTSQAEKLRAAIEKYFASTLAGYETYKYYEGNETLRAWICTPLTVGIYDRSEGTIEALFSDELWTSDGLATEAGQTTFWDRATLYALRGVFAAGATDKAIDFFQYYSKRRLLGDHVPYPVEAYPEGNQRHLSAESALYCRVVTEGLFGIRPTGFSSFTLTPRLPASWDTMALRHIKAFGEEWHLAVHRKENKILVKVYNAEKVFFEKMIEEGATINIKI